MSAEGFWFLLIAWIDWDKGLAFKLVDNEVIKIAFVVSGITDKERALFEAVNALELLDELTGDFGIGEVIGQCRRDEGDAFF